MYEFALNGPSNQGRRMRHDGNMGYIAFYLILVIGKAALMWGLETCKIPEEIALASTDDCWHILRQHRVLLSSLKAARNPLRVPPDSS